MISPLISLNPKLENFIDTDLTTNKILQLLSTTLVFILLIILFIHKNFEVFMEESLKSYNYISSTDFCSYT